jgi:hypothetical protein
MTLVFSILSTPLSKANLRMDEDLAPTSKESRRWTRNKDPTLSSEQSLEDNSVQRRLRSHEKGRSYFFEIWNPNLMQKKNNVL